MPRHLRFCDTLTTGVVQFTYEFQLFACLCQIFIIEKQRQIFFSQWVSFFLRIFVFRLISENMKSLRNLQNWINYSQTWIQKDESKYKLKSNEDFFSFLIFYFHSKTNIIKQSWTIDIGSDRMHVGIIEGMTDRGVKMMIT